MLVLFATAAGGLAAFALSGVAARQLAQPISALRGAALAIAGGEREPTLAAEPITTYASTHSGADAYRQLARELIARGGAA